MQSQVGLANYIGDGFYFSILRCDHGQTKISNLENLVQLAENNMKLALALRITEECFFPIVDPRTGLDLIPLVLYNWRSDISLFVCVSLSFFFFENQISLSHTHTHSHTYVHITAQILGFYYKRAPSQKNHRFYYILFLRYYTFDCSHALLHM